MLGPGSQEIDARGFDAGVAQHIRQLGNILVGPVIRRANRCLQVVRKDLLGATPAALHSRFISAQICRLDKLFPLRVTKSSPEAIFSFRAYFNSFRHSLLGSRITRILPFSVISARPRWAASTVRYFTSLTRTPVPQIASISRARRSLPLALAVSTSRSYSGRVSSRVESRNILRCTFRNFTRKSRPWKRNRLLIAASMELTVAGAWLVETRCSFQAAAKVFCHGPLLQPCGKGPHVPQIFFDGAGRVFLRAQIQGIGRNGLWGQSVYIHSKSLRSLWYLYFTGFKGDYTDRGTGCVWGYDRQTTTLTAVLEKLTAERAELASGVDNEHPALAAVMKYQNIECLTRDILVELLDHIKVYENGNISVRFKFADELRKIVEYIELNAEPHAQVV